MAWHLDSNRVFLIIVFNPQLEGVNWRLNLQMGQASQTKMKIPNAMFEMVVAGSDPDQKEKIRMEFSHDELFEFYNKVKQFGVQ